MTCSGMDRRPRIPVEGQDSSEQERALALLRLPSCEVVIQLLVELLAGTRGNLEHSAVTHELHHISGAIQDGTAVSAILEVRGHDGTEFGVHLIVKII